MKYCPVARITYMEVPSESVTPVPVYVFDHGVSTLWQDQSWGRANLKVCANNLNGNTVNVIFNRDGRSWTYSQRATSNCVTFWVWMGLGRSIAARLTIHGQRSTSSRVRLGRSHARDPPADKDCATRSAGHDRCRRLAQQAIWLTKKRIEPDCFLVGKATITRSFDWRTWSWTVRINRDLVVLRSSRPHTGHRNNNRTTL